MKHVRELIGVVLAVALGLGQVSPAYAILNEPYPYKVRVFEGNRGNVTAPSNSSYPVEQHDTYIEFTVPANSEFTLDTAWDKVSSEYSDLYYVKGFRLAGEDYGTDNRLEKLSFDVTEDMDYVIAYGVKGEMVSYQVVYVDNASGNEIGRSETYYGNVGDKPVVAYEHIPGYRPLYRNISATLVAGTNEWRLPYAKIETQQSSSTSSSSSSSTTTTTTPTTTTTVTTTSDSGSTTSTTSPTTTTSSTATDTTTTTSNVDGTAATTDTDDVSSEIVTPSDISDDTTDNTDSSSGPGDILDLDNPLVDPSQLTDTHPDETEPHGSPAAESDYMMLKVLVGLVILAVIILIVLWRRHKHFFDDTDDIEDDEII